MNHYFLTGAMKKIQIYLYWFLSSATARSSKIWHLPLFEFYFGEQQIK
jgi:hypothetical protein